MKPDSMDFSLGTQPMAVVDMWLKLKLMQVLTVNVLASKVWL